MISRRSIKIRGRRGYLVSADKTFCAKYFPTHFVNVFFPLGESIILTCEVSVGDEEDIKIEWYSSKRSGIIDKTKKLDLSGHKLTDSESSYTAEYWCVATNSDGTGRSQNVTVLIVSPGSFTLQIIYLRVYEFVRDRHQERGIYVI